MSEQSIYNDIVRRTGGDIYIGVVGPVRSGKSTFIKRFMESMVLPNVPEGYARDRARDELPQSGSGKTVMTTEPKFIPDNAVTINIDDSAEMRVKLIDCVGYIVPDVLGTIEEGQPRMVKTAWRDEAMPFVEAAEMGTKKVITEHSTIGMVISTDGTIGEIPRENYIEAEERIIRELKEIGKPFAMILNSADPSRAESVELAYELEEKYGVPVALVNCLQLDSEDIRHILEMVLYEFPVSEIRVKMPSFLLALDENHPLKRSLCESICGCAKKVSKIGEIKSGFEELSGNEFVGSYKFEKIDLGCGKAEISLECRDGLYFDVISELTGFDVKSEDEIVLLLKEYSEKKAEFERVEEALLDAEEKGYGIVMPTASELRLEEPEIIKQSGSYGVRLRASAQSIHLIRANIETEINPIVGTEQQSEDLVKYMLDEFEEDPARIWESNMFGKSLYELMNEGLHTKLDHMPEESRNKLSETLERIINEGSGGLICIIL